MTILNQCARCHEVYAGPDCPACSGKTSPPVESRPPDPLEGLRSFRGLEILGVLGRGGMGIVYKARQVALNRIVALKVLRPERAIGGDTEFRFEQEAQALAALSHPNIVTIHDCGREGELVYFTMECVEGATLRDRIRPGGLPIGEVLAIAAPILDALEYAHSKGIVHRDLKPENILVDSTGRVKVTDFGLAKILQPMSSTPMYTRSGVGLGTPGYMAPEQMEDSRQADPRTDIFALGVILHELLTGERPTGLADPERMAKLPEAMRRVLTRALAPAPSRRYANMGEMKADLKGEASASAPPRPATHRRRRRWAWSLAAIPIAAALGYAFFGRSSPIPKVVPPDLRSLKERHTFFDQEEIARAVVFAPPGKLLASGGDDGVVRVYDVSARTLFRAFPKSKGSVPALAVSSDGVFLAAGGETVRLWRIQGGVAPEILSAPCEIFSLAFHPGGSIVAGAGLDQRIYLWDVAQDRTLDSIPGSGSRLGALGFSPDGKTLASGGEDSTVRLWEWRESRLAATLPGHTDAVTALAYDPTGAVLASASADGTVRIWDPAGKREVRILRGHERDIYSLAWYPDGRFLATGGRDCTIRLWEVRSGDEILTLRGPAKPVTALAFSPDGRWLASAHGDGTVKLWSPDGVPP